MSLQSALVVGNVGNVKFTPPLVSVPPEVDGGVGTTCGPVELSCALIATISDNSRRTRMMMVGAE